MKASLAIAAFILFTFASCKKSNNSNSCSCADAEVCATIVKVAANCDNFGVEINGIQYASTNIPVQFQTVGLKVCVQYNLYNDLRLCACCGGTWADVTSMSKAN